MTLLAPQWSWLLLLIAVSLLYSRNTQEDFEWSAQRIWTMVAMVAVIVALSRPVLSRDPIDVERIGSDVIIAVDLSQSMQATDIEPSRAEAAKRLLQELVSQNEEDRFGVIAFTTNAIVLSPLTDDDELLLHLFGGLDEQMIITKGTRLMPALQLASKMSHSLHPKLLLLTDGGDELGYETEAAFAKSHHLQVDVVMLATRAGSTLKKGDGSMLKDEEGGIVVSARNDAIRTLSDATKGAFIDGPDLGAVIDVLDAQSTEDHRSKIKVMQYTELFYYLIIIAIIAFIFSVTTLRKLAYRRIAPLLLLLGISAEAGVLDHFYLSSAHKAYAQERFEDAAEAFSEVDSRYARYNTANSLYKAGEYEKALQLYQSIRSSDPSFKASIYFDMGNCYIRLQEFKKARAMLIDSLALQESVDARENLMVIIEAEEQDHLLTGRQEGKKREEQSLSESSGDHEKKRKGGGSNMKANADSSQGAGEQGRKTKSDPRLSLSGGKARMSSRQYELINQRSVDEARPW